MTSTTLNFVAPRDHVVVRQDLARAREDHPGARRRARSGSRASCRCRRCRRSGRAFTVDWRRVPGGAGRRGGYGRRQRRQDGEQEASRQSGHESIRAGVDEPDLSDLKAACKRRCEPVRHCGRPLTRGREAVASGRGDRGRREDETPKERADRELIELLNELRVVLPGVTVLFAFLLAVPFAKGWTRGHLVPARRVRGRLPRRRRSRSRCSRRRARTTGSASGTATRSAWSGSATGSRSPGSRPRPCRSRRSCCS